MSTVHCGMQSLRCPNHITIQAHFRFVHNQILSLEFGCWEFNENYSTSHACSWGLNLVKAGTSKELTTQLSVPGTYFMTPRHSV